MRQVKSSKKGFTLIEVILAIVVVAVIMGIAIPKVMSNSDKAQIKQAISSDARSVIEAAADWKRTDRTNANGVYTNLKDKAEYLSSRLPSNMDTNSTNHTIKSSGFNGGCLYSVTDANASSFALKIDCATAASNLAWNNKLKAYAREAFKDTIKSLSSSASIGTENTTDVEMTNIQQ